MQEIIEGALPNLSEKLTHEAMDLLRARRLKLSIAESCTGGLLSYHLIALGGASDVLDGAVISYADRIKSSWLGVSEESLRIYGAVSERVVSEMCVGILQKSGADIALATSGIAGPTGGTPTNLVGSVYIGLQYRGEDAEALKCHFDGDRMQIQLGACRRALEFLVERLR